MLGWVTRAWKAPTAGADHDFLLLHCLFWYRRPGICIRLLHFAVQHQRSCVASRPKTLLLCHEKALEHRRMLRYMRLMEVSLTSKQHFPMT
jgi:hypothetical protein